MDNLDIDEANEDDERSEQSESKSSEDSVNKRRSSGQYDSDDGANRGSRKQLVPNKGNKTDRTADKKKEQGLNQIETQESA